MTMRKEQSHTYEGYLIPMTFLLPLFDLEEQLGLNKHI